MSNTPFEQVSTAAPEQMPAWLACFLWGALGLAVLGALYLYAVRGTALLLDMATMFCF